jgi:signal transduction histidine kinase
MAPPVEDHASLQELYSSVVRAMSEGVVIHDASGAILAANPSAERILGLTLAQMTGSSPLDPSWCLVKPNGAPAGADDIPSEIAQRTGKPCWHVMLGVHRGAQHAAGGELAWLSINTDLVRDEVTGEARLVVATFTDITAKRDLVASEHRLRESNEQLQDITRRLEERNQEYLIALQQAQSSNVAKTMFLTNMSHELRTPLNAVIGFSDLIHKTAATLERDKLLGYIEDIHTAGHHLLSLVNDVLDLSRLEIGAVDAKLQRVALAGLIGDCIRLCWVRANEKNVTIDSNHAGLHLAAFCDPKLLRQVLINVLVNAIKFTPPGSHVVLNLASQDDAVVITLQDQGPGFSQAGLETAFQPFWQERDTLTADNDGVGLGLSIAKRCIDACGGTIGAANVPEGGACITITLQRPQGAAEVTRAEWDI